MILHGIKSERDWLSNIIRSVTIDLKMETIKSGRPYTLRITKTNAAYEREIEEMDNRCGFVGEVGEVVFHIF